MFVFQLRDSPDVTGWNIMTQDSKGIKGNMVQTVEQVIKDWNTRNLWKYCNQAGQTWLGTNNHGVVQS